MSWKHKLGLNAPIKNEKVMEYLKTMGFREDKMNPTYSEDAYWDKVKTHKSPCMFISAEEPGEEGTTINIYINDSEAYMEKITDGFDRAGYLSIEEEITLENIDAFLDKLLS